MALQGYKVGNYATDDMTGKRLLTLIINCGNIAANTAYPAKLNGADYAVTAGKTFYPTGYYHSHDATAFNTACLTVFRYADNAALTTNPVSMDCGVDMPGAFAGAEPHCIPLGGVPVPAGKYFGVFNTTANASNQAGNITVTGYEA